MDEREDRKRGFAASIRLPLGRLRRGGSSAPAPRPRAIFETEIVISDGAELPARLLAQGLDTDEILFKYFWPRYAPPPAAGIRSIVKSEHLRPQFDRLVAMHRIVQSSIPMPLGAVLNPDGDFVGYILEWVSGITLHELLEAGMLEEARRQLDQVEAAVARLHAKSVSHGDINGSNVIAADDGRTLLIDPIPFPNQGSRLQDDLCLEELRRRLDEPG